MKITFIGGGNMATALVGGLIKTGFAAPDIAVIEPSAEKRAHFVNDFGVRTFAADPLDPLALACDVLVLAVKPQSMQPVCEALAGSLSQQLVVSIAAGLPMPLISRWLGGYRQLVRTMPNTPALVGAGITGLCALPEVEAVGRAAAGKVLSAVGQIAWVDDEHLMDAVTAVSGSGPAYVFYFLEALAEAGVEMGFAPEVARQLAVETVSGAALLAKQSSEPLSLLRERVTSKGGTTEAALRSMMADGVKDAVKRGVKAAQTRGRELGQQMGGN